MPVKLSARELVARAEALDECAGHLDQPWTDDPTEWAAGIWLAQRLRKEASRYQQRANEQAKPS